jgi:hypothetical protein
MTQEKTMTKAKMIRRIRSMQKEMGRQPYSATALQFEDTLEEVQGVHARICKEYSVWLSWQESQ